MDPPLQIHTIIVFATFINGTGFRYVIFTCMFLRNIRGRELLNGLTNLCGDIFPFLHYVKSFNKLFLWLLDIKKLQKLCSQVKSLKV